MKPLSALVEKYSVDIEVIKNSRGSWNGPEFVQPSSEPITMRGAIIGTPSAKNYQPGGSYDQEGFNLFINGPSLGKDLIIFYEGLPYSVEEVRDYNRFAGFCKYILKRQNAGEG